MGEEAPRTLFSRERSNQPPPELAAFLSQHQYAALLHATTLGTVLVAKAPGDEIASARGRVPIGVNHELYTHPASPVIRMVTRVYDQPASSLAFEVFVNVGDPDQRADYEALTRQNELVLLFYDQTVTHALSKRVRLRDQLRLQQLLTEVEQLRRQHARHFLLLAEEADQPLRSENAGAWLRRLDAEHANLQAAIAWSAGTADDSGLGLKLATLLVRFWDVRGYYTVGRRWLNRMIDGASENSAKARALAGAGLLATRANDLKQAEMFLDESMRLARLEGDVQCLGSALSNAASTACNRGDYRRSRALWNEGITLFRQLNHEWYLGWTLGSSGYCLELEGDYDGAADRIEQSMAIYERMGGEPLCIGLLNCFFGRVELGRGNLDRAEERLDRALAILRPLASTRGIALTLTSLGVVHHRRGALAGACRLLKEALEICTDLGYPWGLSMCLVAVAAVACSDGHARQGAELLGAVEAYRDELAMAQNPSELPLYEQLIAEACASLGVEGFEAARAKGRTMSLEQAIDVALSFTTDAPTPSTHPAGTLTRREREVAALIGQGLTSRDIADRLIISERTADSHAEHIREKLSLRSRAQIAAWAVEHGLSQSPSN